MKKKIIIENFFSLSFLQMTNYLFPLITFPYLVRVLGPEKFGLVAFAQAFIQYFVVITDYGFLLSATREVSINRNNQKKLSEIFSSVFVIKLIFMFLSFLMLSLTIFLIPRFRTNWLIYIFTFGMLLDNVLFPVWFFQGIEKMKYITIRNIIAKLFFTLAIFYFVRNSQDFFLVPLINSLSFIFVGIISLRIIFHDLGIHLIFPKPSDIVHQLKEGRHIFISKIATNLYTTSNTFILGLFTNNTVVGYYAAAEKIIKALTSCFNPVFQATYPYFTKLATESKEKALEKLNKLFKLTFFISFIIFIIFFTFTGKIISLFLGRNYLESTYISKILSPLLFMLPVAYVLGNLGLLSFKLDKYFSKIYIGGAMINIVTLFFFLLFSKISPGKIAVTNLITEVSITLAIYFILKFNNYKLIL